MTQIAKIILINSDNKLLLALRDNNPAILYPNHWSEIGGAIEENETPLKALKREIKEEISCEVSNIKFIGETFDSVTSCKIMMFRGNFEEKLENIELYEGQKLGLFSFEELNKLLMPQKLKKYILENKEKIIGH